MYHYTPKRQNPAALLFAAATLLVGLAAFSLTAADLLPYPGLIQLGALTLLCISILIITRFLLKSYRYGLEPGADGQTDFTVTECRGNRREVVCRLLHAELIDIRPYDKETRRASRRRKIHNYCIDLFPKDAALLTFRETTPEGEDEDLYVLITPDKTLLRLLRGNS